MFLGNASFKKSLPLCEVFAVVPHYPVTAQPTEGDIELVSLKSSSFCVYAVKRSKKHKWREKTFVFDCEDASLCQEWIDCIQSILSGRFLLLSQDHTLFTFGKNFQKFINPIYKKINKLFVNPFSVLKDDILYQVNPSSAVGGVWLIKFGGCGFNFHQGRRFFLSLVWSPIALSQRHTWRFYTPIILIGVNHQVCPVQRL